MVRHKATEIVNFFSIEASLMRSIVDAAIAWHKASPEHRQDEIAVLHDTVHRLLMIQTKDSADTKSIIGDDLLTHVIGRECNLYVLGDKQDVRSDSITCPECVGHLVILKERRRRARA